MKAKKKKRTNPKILILQGPNLHLLGKREPDIYGKFTLAQINAELKRKAKKYKLSLEIVQSNEEGKLLEKITKAHYDFLIINTAAYTHTSVAIRDGLLAIDKPSIEVHLSNIHKREEFRKQSLVSDIVIGTISGFGPLSYFLALEAAHNYLTANSSI